MLKISLGHQTTKLMNEQPSWQVVLSIGVRKHACSFNLVLHEWAPEDLHLFTFVYICSNKSKTLIWQLMGKQGSNWSFGQVGHNDTISYQVRMMFLRFFKVV